MTRNGNDSRRGIPRQETGTTAGGPAGTAEDAPEPARRQRQSEIGGGAGRGEVERRHGRTWDPGELSAEFDVMGFLAPLVVVRRKADGKKGSLEFQHYPRLYFNWVEDTEQKDADGIPC